MDTSEIIQHRLANQYIWPSFTRSPSEVVSHFGAVQAQDYHASLWAIGLRSRTGLAEVQQAISNGQIIRTWPMRGTLHFVAASDIRWMLELLAPRVISRASGRYRQLELSEVVFKQCREILTHALQGGKIISRSDLYQILEQKGISTASQRGVHILCQLSMEGLLCFGPHQGKQPTHTLLQEWAPLAKRLSREESLASLTQRYFSSHGPATVQDLAWWSGLTLTDAKQGVAMADFQLESHTIDDRLYYFSSKQPKIDASPSLQLLPGFDEYFLGYKDRNLILVPHHQPKVVPGNNGMFLATIVSNGHIVGTWRKKIKGSSVETENQLFDTIKLPPQLLTEAAERYRSFITR
jgi:hypothetical protein